MFTGIIEEVGKIRELSPAGGGVSLSIACRKILEDVKLGDSIAINGTCLTVIAFDQAAGWFRVEAAPETLRLTSLSDWKAGESVNLERAMKADGRFGGHWVAGHVDGMAEIVALQKEGNALVVTFRMEKPGLMKYLVHKGSIAIDGVSLTLTEVKEDTFSVSLIPQTLKETVFSQKKKGDRVNIEVDVLAKYLERFMERAEIKEKSSVSMDLLHKTGFVL